MSNISKAKAFLYSLGAPILYILLQIAALFVIAAYFIADTVINGTFPADPSELADFMSDFESGISEYFLVSLIISGSLFILIMWLRHRKASINLWIAIGATKAVSPKTLYLATLAGLVFYITCQGFIQTIPFPQNWHDANASATQVFADIRFFPIITAGLFIPFVEEVAFRGFTQRILHHAFTPWQAVIVQSVVFGMFHMNMLQASYAFATGIVIGYIYMKSRNLWAAVCFHAAFNGANYLMVLIFGENFVPSSLFLALMAAGGATLTLFLIRNIDFRSFQKEEIE
jgi:hypothetical protein